MHQHIRFRYQQLYLLQVIGMLEIGRIALFIPVDGMKNGGLSFDHHIRHIEFPADVTRARLLDLDHLRAEVGEDLGGPWPGEHAAQVEDAKTGKRTWHDGSLQAMCRASLVQTIEAVTRLALQPCAPSPGRARARCALGRS